MSKLKYSRGNIHHADYSRCLVTDTLPGDVPIIFSNDGFYKNQKKRDLFNADTKQILDHILDPATKSYAVPYRYRITKNEISTRRLSLLHPRSQLEACDFYETYEDIICYYNSKSKFSIRAPQKVGSSFFYKCSLGEKNKYKGGSVDTLDFEKRIRNPSSYFSYSGVDRLYKFFESPKYLRLEKKFSNMWFADVSKCFASIYTHTLLWAVKDMPLSKESNGYKSFGADFDKLMQRQNYNETNGICIGPELSRVFAETIFQNIDHKVYLKAKAEGLKFKVDFECFRYVDDIIIFSNDEIVSSKIYSLFEEVMGEFNLHLNSSKLEKYVRPFQTKKSHVIQKLGSALSKLEERLTDQIKTETDTLVVPRQIYRSNAVKMDFIKTVKSICYDAEVGYEMVANFLISCLSNLLERLIESYEKVPNENCRPPEWYLTSVNLLLDLIFFLYTVQPSVNTSLKLSRAVVLSIKFVKKMDPKRLPFLAELLTGWTHELVKSFETSNPKLTRSKIPIEILNVLLAISEADIVDSFNDDFVEKIILRSKKPDYFSIVCFLFFAKTNVKFSKLRKDLERHLLEHFEKNADVLKYARDAHMFLDLVSCPYIDIKVRGKIVLHTNKALKLKTLSLTKCRAIAAELELESWFTNWKEVDLLNMIRRKELSAVY